MGLVELGGDAHELSDVLDAALGLVGVLSLEGLDEAGLVDDGLDHLGQLALEVAAGLDGAGEAGERLAHLGREQAGLADALLAGGEERDALVGRKLRDLGDGGAADAAARGVDDALDGHVVVGVADGLEVGHDVADLRAVEEARAADDLVRHTGAQEHVLEDAGLCVGAVEDGDVVVAHALAVGLLDLPADPAALLALVRGLVDADLLAVSGRGEQALCLAAGVVGHHGVGRVQDVAGGAVVLLQADGAGVRVVLLEVQDVLDVGATPGVDGLVVVADDHEVSELGGQQVGDGVLDVVGVLVLVDADLEEAVLVALEDARVLGEQLVGLDQQVVKVHGVGLGQAGVQGAVDAASGAVGRVG